MMESEAQPDRKRGARRQEARRNLSHGKIKIGERKTTEKLNAVCRGVEQKKQRALTTITRSKIEVGKGKQSGNLNAGHHGVDPESWGGPVERCKIEVEK